jgi:hypothetical protein
MRYRPVEAPSFPRRRESHKIQAVNILGDTCLRRYDAFAGMTQRNFQPAFLFSAKSS